MTHLSLPPFSASRRIFSATLIGLFVLMGAAACTSRPQQVELLITLVVDGRERTFQQPIAITVGEFLTQNEVEVTAPDEVMPPVFTQLSDGMRITVVRVREENECAESELPYRTQRIPNEALSAGEERLAQNGQAGIEQICYRIAVRDGVRQEPIEISRVTVREAQDEVVYIGPSGEIEPIAIEGTLAYLSNGNIWVVRGSSTNKRQLTDTGDADLRVFDLSADGRQLLFTRRSEEDGAFNRLWMITDTTRGVSPIALAPVNILDAAWVPGRPFTLSYSTAEMTAAAPGWDADNNLWEMAIDPATGESLSTREIVPSSLGGLDGWWGTDFTWSPNGNALAWVRADAVGLVDLSSGALNPLVEYTLFETRQSWSWRAGVSWSPDGAFLLTTVHGDPVGSEPPETSPAFHVAVADLAGRFSAEIALNAGIWSMPAYAPRATAGDGRPQSGIAYLRARDLANNVNPTAAYDLVIADRDGSNAEVIFPEPGGAGLRADAALTWSPDGGHLAFIYNGNVWVIDVRSRIAHALTLDGRAASPVWTE